jgi:hypothetical protein
LAEGESCAACRLGSRPVRSSISGGQCVAAAGLTRQRARIPYAGAIEFTCGRVWHIFLSFSTRE